MPTSGERLDHKFFSNRSRSIMVHLWDGKPFGAELVDHYLNKTLKRVIWHDVGDFWLYWGTTGLMTRLEKWAKASRFM